MNLQNRSIYKNDNLQVLLEMSDKCVDLIYLDPPFAKNQTFVGTNTKIAEIKKFFTDIQKKAKKDPNYQIHKGFSDININAIFKHEDPAKFQDIWTENDVNAYYFEKLSIGYPEMMHYISSIKKTAKGGIYYYLIFMAVRLIELHRVLKETGSIYLHCDPHAGHYLKVLMDYVFGKDNFCNEIVWCYEGPSSPNMKIWGKKHDTLLFYTKKTKQNTWYWQDVAETYATTSLKAFKSDSKWGNRTQYITRGKYPKDWWSIPSLKNTKEGVGYPTQKPLALLERIIKASSNAGDLVLDPFCGCTTTCVAAELNNRQWIGIDINPHAFYLSYYRLTNHGFTRLSPKRNFYVDVFLESIEEKELDKSEAFFLEQTNKPPKRQSAAEIKAIKETLFEKQEGQCLGCLKEYSIHEFTVDHIIPLAKKGKSRMDNYQLLCHVCNSFKGTNTMAHLIQTNLKNGRITNLTYNILCTQHKIKQAS